MKKIIVAALAALTVTGCAGGPQFFVETNSLASNYEFDGATYHLWPMNPDVTPDDLQYQEYADQMERALDIQGLDRVPLAKDADLLIMFSYGIGAPRSELFSYVVPVQGVTGTTTTTTGNATVNTFGNTLYGSGTTTSNTRVQRGTVGYTTGTRARTVFDRFLLIKGREINLSAEMSEWKTAFETTVTSSGSSGDLRQVLPVMIAAAADKIATDTGRQVETVMGENDDLVIAIRGYEAE